MNPIKFYLFVENEKLCACQHIDFYIERTKEYHKIES